MTFNCYKRKRNKRARFLRKLRRLGRWHTKFAWYPIQLSNKKCIWLETIEIKKSKHFIHDFFYISHSREIEK